MSNKLDFSKVSEAYTNMSEGDKSCVVAAQQNSGAQQMTSIGSYHDKFYEELSKSGWTESVELSADLAKFGTIRSWKFTDTGKRSMPTLLLALTTTNLRKELDDNRLAEMGKFCLKLFVCYLICQVCVFLVGFIIGKLEIDVSVFRGYLSVVAVLLSILVSLILSSKIWKHNKPEEALVKNIAYARFIGLHIKTLSILAAVTVLLIHIGIEFFAIQFGWQNEPKSLSKILIQCAVLSAIIGWFSITFLPKINQVHYDKQFN